MYNVCSYSNTIILAISPDVRLVSTDSRPYAGRIEVFFNNKWGQICFQRNSSVLSVICAQLGYDLVGALPFRVSILGNTPVWLDNDLDCVGNEDTIFDCPSLDIGKVLGGSCDNGAAGVICPICKFCIIQCINLVTGQILYVCKCLYLT